MKSKLKLTLTLRKDKSEIESTYLKATLIKTTFKRMGDSMKLKNSTYINNKNRYK